MALAAVASIAGTMTAERLFTQHFGVVAQDGVLDGWMDMWH